MSEQTSLASLRQQIDAIDNQILESLAARQALSREIVKQKVLGSDVFRPDREASLLRALIAKHQTIDAALIVGLWRQIISASIAEQKPNYLIAHSEVATRLSHHHAAGFLNETACKDAVQAVAMLQKKDADCALIDATELEDIKDSLGADAGLYVVSKLPLLADLSYEEGYIIARSLPLATGDDITMTINLSGNEAGLISCHDGHLDSALLPNQQIIGIYARPFAK